MDKSIFHTVLYDMKVAIVFCVPVFIIEFSLLNDMEIYFLQCFIVVFLKSVER